mgnify:CR=1 FL=1
MYLIKYGVFLIIIILTNGNSPKYNDTIMNKRISDAVKVFETYLQHGNKEPVIRNLGGGQKATLKGTRLKVTKADGSLVGGTANVKPGEVRRTLAEILAMPDVMSSVFRTKKLNSILTGYPPVY